MTTPDGLTGITSWMVSIRKGTLRFCILTSFSSWVINVFISYTTDQPPLFTTFLKLVGEQN